MPDPIDYTPPKVWTWTTPNGGTFGNINRPIAGPTHEKKLPVGKHPLQLYSLATPNGVKVTIMLEELLALGHVGAEYDAWLIKIGDGDQFGSGFTAVNPNSKIPALMDLSGPTPVRVFESGSILLYLAEKFGALLPKDIAGRTEALNWLFWQMGSAPYLGGGFWSLLQLCADEDRICDRSVRNGSEAPSRRSRPAIGRDALSRGRRLYDCRYRSVRVVRIACEGLAV